MRETVLQAVGLFVVVVGVLVASRRAWRRWDKHELRPRIPRAGRLSGSMRRWS
jgi:hypothetical protein